MTTETKQMFTRRIVSANRTQLVVVTYDMLLAYMADAKESCEAGNIQEFEQNAGYARDCVKELRSSLNFDYEISNGLFAVYCFVERELARMSCSHKADTMDALIQMLTKLRDAFDAVSQSDTSEPLMENAQDVYAGYTYGRNDLNESLTNYGGARGFVV